MTCPCTEELSAYSDGILEASEQGAIALHLQTCVHCQQKLDGFVALRQGLRTLPSPPLGFDVARSRNRHGIGLGHMARRTAGRRWIGRRGAALCLGARF
jgi:anti-sigma factor RsiW